MNVPLAGPPSSGVVLAGCRAAVLGGSDGSIRVIGPVGGSEIVLTNAHKREVYLMDASLDGSTLATKELDFSENAQVRIWRLPRLEPIAALPHAQHVHGVKLSDDGKLLAGFTGPGDMGVWEIPSMKGPPMWRGVAALGRVRVCAFSPDNRWLAAATPDDGGAFLWNLATHRRTVLPRALTEYTSMSFSPDGSRLAAGSEGESKLFDTATGQAVLSFKQPGLKLAFARDDERLVWLLEKRVECLVQPYPVPDSAAINALWSGHPAIADHLVEFCHANADVFGGLDPRQAPWGKRRRQATDRVPVHCRNSPGYGSARNHVNPRRLQTGP